MLISKSEQLTPIDRYTRRVMIALGCVMGVMVGAKYICTSERCLIDTRPEVKEFSWDNKTVTGQDRGFVITFDNPMDNGVVEKI
ncbi:MAG: hypothetical protein HC796_10620 [Synechococcaceae cyanobacterium RL_1_2]|nr:hypothetical protein [Synechococcaceae cyanobacterium RL_1_2]